MDEPVRGCKPNCLPVAQPGSTRAAMIERAFLLSAGRGSRLLPLTAERPKCLIELSGRSLLAWQVVMLARSGIRRIDVVTGFATDMVEAHLDTVVPRGVEVAAHFNPFFQVADNLGSCWIVRDLMAEGDFLLLNGDTLVPTEAIARAQQPTRWPIAVTIDRKDEYDIDDMKVALEGERLVRIGKTLPAEETDAESVGMLAFTGDGPAMFHEAVRREMRTPEGVNHWYLKVIDGLANAGNVGTLSISGLGWAEVDYLTDIEQATLLTDHWAKES